VVLAVYSQRKSVSLSTVIEKSKPSHDGIKMPDKCTFCDGWWQSNKNYLQKILAKTSDVPQTKSWVW
jgi:hypothetical protein